MKFSLRLKIPLGILGIFLLFLMSVTGYMRLVVVDNMTKEFEDVNKSYGQIAKGILQNYHEREEMLAFMNRFAEQKQLGIGIYNMQGEELYKVDYRLNKDVHGHYEFVYIYNDGDLFRVRVSHERLNVFQAKPMQKLQLFAVTGLVVVLLAIIVIVHRNILSPIKKLGEGVDRVNYANTEMKIDYHKKNEIGQLCRQFENMAARIRDSYIQQNEMVAAISHDIRTPLTSVMGYIERMTDKKLSDAKQKEYLDIVYRKAQDIEKLVQQLSAYTKNEIELNEAKEPINMKVFMMMLCEQYRTELQSMDVTFQYSCDLEEDVTAEIDKNKIKRVFSNLIGNALKYGGHHVHIQIRFWREKNHLYVSVEDNGQGLPEEELDNIFHKFYRVEKSRSRNQGGIGLGLSICSSIIESHQGEIWAEHGEWGGLKIVFNLPIKRLNKN